VKRFASFLQVSRKHAKIGNLSSVYSIRQPSVTADARRREKHSLPGREVGEERTSTGMAALVDTNILVYRFDSRFAGKQKIATGILRRGIVEDSVRVPHQAIIEFVAAVTRPIRGHVILKQADALREAEEFLKQFTVLYPNEAILREAIRGCAAYQLNWFDAHLWSYAEHYGLPEILTEDLQHDRLYGSVKVVNPFVGLR
jgi:predicted nucleic acid-binding protein